MVVAQCWIQTAGSQVFIAWLPNLKREKWEMKRLIECEEKEGLEKLLGETITVFCMNYIYTGVLIGLNETCLLLKDPSIVYETGDFKNKTWKDAQRLPEKHWYVMLSSIESFGIMK